MEMPFVAELEMPENDFSGFTYQLPSEEEDFRKEEDFCEAKEDFLNEMTKEFDGFCILAEETMHV